VTQATPVGEGPHIQVLRRRTLIPRARQRAYNRFAMGSKASLLKDDPSHQQPKGHQSRLTMDIRSNILAACHGTLALGPADFGAVSLRVDPGPSPGGPPGFHLPGWECSGGGSTAAGLTSRNRYLHNWYSDAFGSGAGYDLCLGHSVRVAAESFRPTSSGLCTALLAVSSVVFQ
jgi:hypothetical protein